MVLFSEMMVGDCGGLFFRNKRGSKIAKSTHYMFAGGTLDNKEVMAANNRG